MRLKKLYSKDGKFKTVNFRDGINFILGERSEKGGKVISEKRNGAGKSLCIELINFCLLKQSNLSRIVNNVPDNILPKDSLVYLDFSFGGKQYTIARNKAQKIQIIENGQETEYDFSTAKIELKKILKISSKHLSARDYVNFVIKESHYNYSDFLQHFTCEYFESIKPTLYFFGLSINIFQEIKDVQGDYEIIKVKKRHLDKKLSAKGLTLEELKSAQTDMEFKIEAIEKKQDYPDIVQKIENEELDIKKEESDLNRLISEKQSLKMQLSEIESFLDNFYDDLDVSDIDIARLFNRYKKGLGDFVKNDLESLKEFRTQILLFKEELLEEKLKKLKDEIAKLSLQIDEKTKKIEKYNFLFLEYDNFLQKNLKIYQGKNQELEDIKTILREWDEYDNEVHLTRGYFNEKYQKLNEKRLSIKKLEDDFRRDFTTINKSILDGGLSSFGFRLSPDPKIDEKKYFKILATVEKEGSDGNNRVRAVIYDFALAVNQHTKDRFGGLMIHENLIFGYIDKATSANILNYLWQLEAPFQYIATVNTDEISDQFREKLKFNFSTDINIAVSLSIQDPLFGKQFHQTARGLDILGDEK